MFQRRAEWKKLVRESDHRRSPVKRTKFVWEQRRWGFLTKSHFGLQMVVCVHIGRRVEAESAIFCSFRGRVGVSSETNFVRFAGLLRTFAMAP